MQQLRFLQLLRLFEKDAGPFSLADVGCGYGAFLSFLDARLPGACSEFIGIDWSPEMVRRARRLHRLRAGASFETPAQARRATDYCVASGIFNVKLDFPQHQWEEHIERTLAAMHVACVRGFAVNMMADWPGPESSSQLYRTTPERWIGTCEAFGTRVEVLRRYGMREFTLIARKSVRPADPA